MLKCVYEHSEHLEKSIRNGFSTHYLNYTLNNQVDLQIVGFFFHLKKAYFF